MVNFGAVETVPEKFKDRVFHIHNPQVTLMRSSAEENQGFGSWIAERLNQMTGPVRFLLPMGGVSALDAPDMPFHDPEADAVLFEAIETGVAEKSNLIRVPDNLNTVAFAQAAMTVYQEIT